MLFVEIALTVAAWRKGWKALALAPLAIAIALAVFATQSGMNPQGMIVLDVGAIAVLGFMCVKGRDQAPAPGWGGPPPQQSWSPAAQQAWAPQAQPSWAPQAQPSWAPPAQQSWTPQAQKTCSRCNTPAPAGHTFCVGCGNSLA